MGAKINDDSLFASLNLSTREDKDTRFISLSHEVQFSNQRLGDSIRIDYSGIQDCQKDQPSCTVLPPKRRKLNGENLSEGFLACQNSKALSNELPNDQQSPFDELSCQNAEDNHVNFERSDNITTPIEISTNPLLKINENEASKETCNLSKYNTPEALFFLASNTTAVPSPVSPTIHYSHSRASSINAIEFDSATTIGKSNPSPQGMVKLLSEIKHQKTGESLVRKTHVKSLNENIDNVNQRINDQNENDRRDRNKLQQSSFLGSEMVVPRYQADTHIQDIEPSSAPSSFHSDPNHQKSTNIVSSDCSNNELLHQKIISSLPMACLLELARPNRDAIFALIMELTTYGDYRDSSPNYKIPDPYRYVFDELRTQWSVGTSKNEFRKALIAYIREKIEARMSLENSAESTNHACSKIPELFQSQTGFTDSIFLWIDEMKIMQESSKELLRYIFGQNRENMNHLRDLNLNLQVENVKLREDVQKLSAKLREAEADNRRREYASVNFDSIKTNLTSKQEELLPNFDFDEFYDQAVDLDPNRKPEMSQDILICCEHNSILDGQSFQSNDFVQNQWKARDTCLKCSKINDQKRFYILREQIVSMKWDVFREIIDSHSDTGKIALPSISGISSCTPASLTFSLTENMTNELLPPLMEVPPLSESTPWGIGSSQIETWPKLASSPISNLELNITENFTFDHNKEKFPTISYRLKTESKDSLNQNND